MEIFIAINKNKKLRLISSKNKMVITFCISSIPEDTFSILDSKRLGKQRIEAQTIIKTLDGQGSGYLVSLPIVRMWSEHVEALKYYFNCCVDEWVSRGYKNNLEKYELKGIPVFPFWFSNKQVHESMKASLLRKNEEYYSSKISLAILTTLIMDIFILTSCQMSKLKI